MDYPQDHRTSKPPRIHLTRRRLLRLAVQSTLLTALTPKLARAAAIFLPDDPAHSVSPVMQQLSAYMAAPANRALPDEVLEKTKQHILDTFAAMVSGSRRIPETAALDFASASQG